MNFHALGKSMKTVESATQCIERHAEPDDLQLELHESWRVAGGSRPDCGSSGWSPTAHDGLVSYGRFLNAKHLPRKFYLLKRCCKILPRAQTNQARLE